LHEIVKTSDGKTVEIENLSAKLGDSLAKLKQLQEDYGMGSFVMFGVKICATYYIPYLLYVLDHIILITFSF
jgi:hypothetical protein